jgi:hypothetical protein
MLEKFKGDTDKEYRHYDIYDNGDYIGYVIDNKIVFNGYYSIGKRWMFIPANYNLYTITYADTKKDCINKITKKSNTAILG